MQTSPRSKSNSFRPVANFANAVQYFDEFFDDTSAQKVSDLLSFILQNPLLGHRQIASLCKFVLELWLKGDFLSGIYNHRATNNIPTYHHSACASAASLAASSEPRTPPARSNILESVNPSSPPLKDNKRSPTANWSSTPPQADRLLVEATISGAAVPRIRISLSEAQVSYGRLPRDPRTGWVLLPDLNLLLPPICSTSGLRSSARRRNSSSSRTLVAEPCPPVRSPTGLARTVTSRAR